MGVYPEENFFKENFLSILFYFIYCFPQVFSNIIEHLLNARHFLPEATQSPALLEHSSPAEQTLNE
jgi:hypothetical protein